MSKRRRPGTAPRPPRPPCRQRSRQKKAEAGQGAGHGHPPPAPLSLEGSKKKAPTASIPVSWAELGNFGRGNADGPARRAQHSRGHLCLRPGAGVPPPAPGAPRRTRIPARRPWNRRPRRAPAPARGRAAPPACCTDASRISASPKMWNKAQVFGGAGGQREDTHTHAPMKGTTGKSWCCNVRRTRRWLVVVGARSSLLQALQRFGEA